MKIFDFLRSILEKYFFSKMIFCEGPGRVIGIRIAMLFLRSYSSMMEGVSTFSYTSLGFALKTNDTYDTIICPKGLGNFFALSKDSDAIYSVDTEGVKSLNPERTAFLQTKPGLLKNMQNFDFAKYDPMADCITALKSTRSNCMARSLFDSAGEFVIWDGKRHQ
jgi:hypothetical protein